MKRYVAEEESDVVRRFFIEGTRLATCRVTYAEAAAAIARRWREGVLTETERDRLIKSVAEDLEEMVVLNVTRDLLAPIAKIVRAASVRGFDAVHLAAALRLARPEAGAVHFVCSDTALGQAADRLGMDWVDPTRDAVH